MYSSSRGSGCTSPGERYRGGRVGRGGGPCKARSGVKCSSSGASAKNVRFTVDTAATAVWYSGSRTCAGTKGRKGTMEDEEGPLLPLVAPERLKAEAPAMAKGFSTN